MDRKQMIFFVTLIIKGYFANGMTSSKAMTAMCNANLPVYVNHSLILELTNEILEDRTNKFLHCAVDIITKPRHRILIHFISLDISYDNRSPDRLHIYDYGANGQVKQMTPPMGLFGVYDSYYKHTSTGVKDYLSSKTKLRLDYQGRPSLTYSGFRILLTSFKGMLFLLAREPSPKGNCGKMYRKCTRNNRMCVPLEVMCDLEYNCGEGDESDEDKCEDFLTDGWDSTDTTIMAAVAAVIAIGVFLLIVSIVTCILMKFTKRKYIRSDSLQVGIKKTKNGEWSLTNNVDRMGVTEMYAPPTYEDVIGVEDEPPPAYDALKNIPRSSRVPSRNNPQRTTVVCIENNCMRSADQINQGDISVTDNMVNQSNTGSALNLEQSSDTTSSSCHLSNESVAGECCAIYATHSENGECDKTSTSSSPDTDSGNFAGCSSHESNSSQNDDDFISVASEQLLLDKNCDIKPETDSYLAIGRMNDLASGQVLATESKRKNEQKSNLKIDLENRICILNCDDIEYMDDKL